MMINLDARVRMGLPARRPRHLAVIGVTIALLGNLISLQVLTPRAAADPDDDPPLPISIEAAGWVPGPYTPTRQYDGGCSTNGYPDGLITGETNAGAWNATDTFEVQVTGTGWDIEESLVQCPNYRVLGYSILVFRRDVTTGVVSGYSGRSSSLNNRTGGGDKSYVLTVPALPYGYGLDHIEMFGEATAGVPGPRIYWYPVGHESRPADHPAVRNERTYGAAPGKPGGATPLVRRTRRTTKATRSTRLSARSSSPLWTSTCPARG